MEDEATAGWLLLAMDRVSNFVRILWLSGLVEGSDLEPQGDDTCVSRLSECILRGSIDDCRLLIFEWVIGCWVAVPSNQQSEIVNHQSSIKGDSSSDAICRAGHTGRKCDGHRRAATGL